MGIRRNWIYTWRWLLILGLLVTFAPGPALQAQGSSILALVRGKGATLYAQPEGEVVQTLAPGDRLDATGRTQDALWIIGKSADGVAGWLRAEDVIIYDLLTLPVVESMAAPVAQPAPAPANQSPTATATATPPPPPPTPTPTPTSVRPPSGGRTVTGVVRSGGVELVSAPQGQALESLTTGTGVTVVGRSADGAWVLVTSGSGITGWVERGRLVVFSMESVPVVALPPSASPSPAQAVAASGESSTSLAGTVAVPGSRLNVRAGPGAAYAIVGKLTDGASVSLLARSGDSSWVQVALAEGAFGWVSARYITTKGGVESLPISTATSGAKAAQSLPAPAPASQSARSQPAGLPGKLALAAADGSIVLYNLTSGATSRLTNGFDPAISPDGQRVAFLRGGQGLLVMDIDGSNERMLYNGVELRAPAWSPDGQYVVFSRVNGQEPCRDPGFGLCLPDVPQFAHYPLVIKDLRVISRIGTDSKDFEDIPSQKTAMSPSWTEAGIVYQSSDGLQITQDGPSHDKEGNPVNRQVTNLYIHRDPAWRPDGWLIAFVDDRPVHREIYVVDPNGNGMTALTRPASALLKEFPHNVAPVWSPDGQQIAFLSNRDGDWGVFAMNADGSNQRRLPVAVEMTYRFQSEQSISWGR